MKEDAARPRPPRRRRPRLLIGSVQIPSEVEEGVQATAGVQIKQMEKRRRSSSQMNLTAARRSRVRMRTTKVGRMWPDDWAAPFGIM